MKFLGHKFLVITFAFTCLIFGTLFFSQPANASSLTNLSFTNGSDINIPEHSVDTIVFCSMATDSASAFSPYDVSQFRLFGAGLGEISMTRQVIDNWYQYFYTINPSPGTYRLQKYNNYEWRDIFWGSTVTDGNQVSSCIMIDGIDTANPIKQYQSMGYDNGSGTKNFVDGTVGNIVMLLAQTIQTFNPRDLILTSNLNDLLPDKYFGSNDWNNVLYSWAKITNATTTYSVSGLDGLNTQYSAVEFNVIPISNNFNDHLIIYDGGYYTDPNNLLANVEDIYRFIYPPSISGDTYSNTPFKFIYDYCDYLDNEYLSKGLCSGSNTNCPDFSIHQHYEPKNGSNNYPDYDIIKTQAFVNFHSCSGIYDFYPDDTPLKDGKTFISLYDENNPAIVAISNEVNYKVSSLSHLQSGNNFIRLNGDYHYTKKFSFNYNYSDDTFNIPVVWDFCGLNWYDEETGYEVCLSGSDRYCVVADSCSGFGYIEHPVPDNGEKLNRTLLVLEPLPSVDSPYLQNDYWFTIEKADFPPVDSSLNDFCEQTTENFVSYGFCWITKEVFNPIFNTVKSIPSQIFPINVFNVFVETWEDSADKALSSDFSFLFSSVNASGDIVVNLPNQLFSNDSDFVIFSKNWFKGDSVLSGFFNSFKKITPYLFFIAYLIFIYSLLRKVKNNNLD